MPFYIGMVGFTVFNFQVDLCRAKVKKGQNNSLADCKNFFHNLYWWSVVERILLSSNLSGIPIYNTWQLNI